MVDFRPFEGWRPPAERVEEVACVPYDVVDVDEVRSLTANKPLSMLHVTRPDADLPADADPHGPEAYVTARKALRRLVKQGALVKDSAPAYYAYAQAMGEHRQLGLVGLAAIDDYFQDRIKKHEHTRPQKEDDRMRHVEAVRAHLGPVFLTHRADPVLDGHVASAAEGEPAVDFVAPDGVRHTLWAITDERTVLAIQAALETTDALYVADGHHRAAAASRVGRESGFGDAALHFLAVTFPHDQLAILPYNRVVRDLGEYDADGLLAALAVEFDVEPAPDAVEPAASATFGMYLGGGWYTLRYRGDVPKDDPVRRLDVSLLQEKVLEPLLGIADPRRDERIAFVGGIRGTGELAARVDASGGVAFSMFPTSLEDLMAIADAGEVMPPKSTWFEPKLRTGLVINRFGELPE